MRSAVLGLMIFAALAASSARAQPAQEQPLTELEAVHHACHSASESAPLRVYVLTTDEAGFRFTPYDGAESALRVDPSWNLRAMDGAVQGFARRGEAISFDGSAAEAEALVAAAQEGARLRVGFFLGFDGDGASACLARPASAVTMLRLDLAFAELVGADGDVLARHETERLRAYLDDPEQSTIPGQGPRGALGEPSLIGGAPSLPRAWAAALARPTRARALGACLEGALGRGATAPATVIARLRVHGASGAIRAAELELSTLGDDEGATCVREALAAGGSLGPGGIRGDVELRVPVRLVQ